MSILWAARAHLDHPEHPRAEEAIEAASFILWSLSGRQYTGIRTVTETYSTTGTMAAGAKPYPVKIGGCFYNITSDCCCSGCGVFHRTRLRGTPVRRILKVYVDGRQLQPDEYVLLDHGVLGFLTPSVCCAECITVTYIYGFLPPGGEAAAAKLANELLASSEGSDCDLPQRVTSISRQGVNFTLLDPQDFINDRRTGIYEIDLMLAALNPAKSLMRPRVFSVDLPKAETWKQLPPPPSAVVNPGDQAVIIGHKSFWLVDSATARGLVDQGEQLRTQVGMVISRRDWEPVQNTPYEIFTVLRPEDTSAIMAGDKWAVLDSADNVLASGQIEVI